MDASTPSRAGCRGRLGHVADRPYHHGDLRAALLRRGEEVLRSDGVDALSLRGLARDVGVSPGAPNRHFASKRELLDGLAVIGFQRAADEVTESLAQVEPTFAAQIDAIARSYVRFAVGESALLQLMYSAKRQADASPTVQAAATRFFARLLAVLADGQEVGSVRAGDPERIALPIFAALHGYATLVVSGMLPAGDVDEGLGDVIAAARTWATDTGASRPSRA